MLADERRKTEVLTRLKQQKEDHVLLLIKEKDRLHRQLAQARSGMTNKQWADVSSGSPSSASVSYASTAMSSGSPSQPRGADRATPKAVIATPKMCKVAPVFEECDPMTEATPTPASAHVDLYGDGVAEVPVGDADAEATPNPAGGLMYVMKTPSRPGHHSGAITPIPMRQLTDSPTAPASRHRVFASPTASLTARLPADDSELMARRMQRMSAKLEDSANKVQRLEAELRQAQEANKQMQARQPSATRPRSAVNTPVSSARR